MGPSRPAQRSASQGAPVSAPLMFRPPVRSSAAVAWQDNSTLSLAQDSDSSHTSAKRLDSAEASSLLEGAGYEVSEGEFEQIWERATQGSDSKQVAMSALVKACAAMHMQKQP